MSLQKKIPRKPPRLTKMLRGNSKLFWPSSRLERSRRMCARTEALGHLPGVSLRTAASERSDRETRGEPRRSSSGSRHDRSDRDRSAKSRPDVASLKANSHCRSCGAKGHWHRECPQKSSSSKQYMVRSGSFTGLHWSLTDLRACFLATSPVIPGYPETRVLTSLPGFWAILANYLVLASSGANSLVLASSGPITWFWRHRVPITWFPIALPLLPRVLDVCCVLRLVFALFGRFCPRAPCNSSAIGALSCAILPGCLC